MKVPVDFLIVKISPIPNILLFVVHLPLVIESLLVLVVLVSSKACFLS